MTNTTTTHNRIPQAIMLCLTLCLTAACENKWPRNGHLDGQWQLLTVEHDGHILDMKDRQLYLSFQLDLIQLNNSGNQQRYYGYFRHTGDTIIFRQFSDIAEYDTKNDDNLPVSPRHRQWLKDWGYYADPDTFRIEQLSHNDMVLRSDSARIVYRKF
jgi:hypothetical protein